MVKKVKLQVGDERIKEDDHFCHLRSEITRDARCEKGVKIRIMEAKIQFGQLRKFLSNSKVSSTTRKHMIICYVWSVLLYGPETWTLHADLVKRLQAFEMWC